MIKRAITIFFLTISLNGLGQSIKPQAQFQLDTIAIGEEVPYSLWIRYPKEQDVIFPDSLFDFSPFEINKRNYFTTRTDSTESLDSVVYYLTTFEIDSTQFLQLPIYLIDQYDSIELLPTKDSIILRHVVEALPDSAAVIVNTDFQKVPLAFNYPYFTAGLIVLLVVILVIFLVFGKRIRQTIRVYWLTKRHKEFINLFNDLLADQPIEVERTLSAWKKYLERIEKQPFTKLTSKEMVQYDFGKELKDPLRAIDRCVYGKIPSETIYQDFQHLKDFAQNRYYYQVNKIMPGHMSENKYAGFWLRFVAYCIDSIILGAGFLIIGIIIAALGFVAFIDNSGSMEEQNLSSILTTIISYWIAQVFFVVVVAPLYYTLMESSKYQGTIGKIILGLKVTDTEGSKLYWEAALGRYFFRFLSYIGLIGFIMAGLTNKKQALHDLIMGTLVVRKFNNRTMEIKHG